MKISVVTVAYNECEKIIKTVQSVKAQNYCNIEYILVDGGSTDGTVENALRVFPDLLVISESDEGIYDAMNKGVERANGELVVILNCGDYLLPHAFKHLVSCAKTGCDIIAMSIARYNSCGAYKLYCRADWSLSFANPGVQHPGIVVRKSVYDLVGAFDLQYKVSADYEFLCRAISRGCVIRYSNYVFTEVEAVGFSSSRRNLISKRIEHFKIYRKYVFSPRLRFKKFIQLFYVTIINLAFKAKPEFDLAEEDLVKANADYL